MNQQSKPANDGAHGAASSNSEEMNLDEDSSPMLGFVNKAGFSPYSKSINQNSPSLPNMNPEDDSNNASSSRRKDLSSPMCKLKKCQTDSQESEVEDDYGRRNADNVNLDLSECNLNQELKTLMKMHEETKVEIA